jgi:uncharacterized RDD family membrane protein YckC
VRVVCCCSPIPVYLHLCLSLSTLYKPTPREQNFTDLLACRLCQAAAFAPVAVTLHSEQVLTDLAHFDPRRLVQLLVPFASTPPASASATALSPAEVFSYSNKHQGASPNVRLLALHVLAATVRHLSSSQLLAEMPSLVAAALPSLSSSLVDLRKAVIFVLVEAFLVVGDALYPFVEDLPPPQRKLLTIYIDRKMTVQQ